MSASIKYLVIQVVIDAAGGVIEADDHVCNRLFDEIRSRETATFSFDEAIQLVTDQVDGATESRGDDTARSGVIDRLIALKKERAS